MLVRWCILITTASNAGFDDPAQVRIQMEALACQEVFARVARSEIVLAWSFMHEDETILCPFPARRLVLLHRFYRQVTVLAK